MRRWSAGLFPYQRATTPPPCANNDQRFVIVCIAGSSPHEREIMYAVIRDPEQVFSFAFITGCISGYLLCKLIQICKRMDERTKR